MKGMISLLPGWAEAESTHSDVLPQEAVRVTSHALWHYQDVAIERRNPQNAVLMLYEDGLSFVVEYRAAIFEGVPIVF